MQEIEYEDGTKERVWSVSFAASLADARKKEKKKPIKKLTITKTTVKGRERIK